MLIFFRAQRRYHRPHEVTGPNGIRVPATAAFVFLVFICRAYVVKNYSFLSGRLRVMFAIVFSHWTVFSSVFSGR